MNSVSYLQIGGITIRIQTDDPRLAVPVTGPMCLFTGGEGAPDLDVTVTWLETPSAAPAGTLLFDSGSVWRLYDAGDHYRIECRSELFGTEPYKVALVNREFTRAEVRMRAIAAPGENGLRLSHPLEFPLDELLVNALLTLRGGVEIHSCGVIDADGNGYLFAGNSGDGKTTTARLWQQEAAEIISDDRAILRRENGAWWMYGTPWHGEAEICSASRAPLRRIFLLSKSTQNAVMPTLPGQAVARLLSCAFPPFHDGNGLTAVVATLARITSEVPVAELQFANDRTVIDFVRENSDVAA